MIKKLYFNFSRHSPAVMFGFSLETKYLNIIFVCFDDNIQGLEFVTYMIHQYGLGWTRYKSFLESEAFVISGIDILNAV